MDPEGRSLRLTVLPPFYRTWWFLTLAALGAGGVLLLSYKYRVARLERAAAAQEAFSRRLITSQEGERRRIAAELHDGLGQSLVIIRNWALLGSGSSRRRPRREDWTGSPRSRRGRSTSPRIAYDLGRTTWRLGLADTIRDMVSRVARASKSASPPTGPARRRALARRRDQPLPHRAGGAQ